MILRYAANLKLAKELYDSSKPKLQGSQEMIGKKCVKKCNFTVEKPDKHYLS